jgi:phosphinothricin acetyltransferase
MNELCNRGKMEIVDCGEQYAEQIRAIFNEAIATSTALYDYAPRSSEMMRQWFAAKKTGNYPVIGMVTESGELAGFGSYGTFRAWPAYKYTVEHSLYVATGFRGQGTGRRLMQEIILLAGRQGYHLLIGGIDSENTASKELHRKFGFTHAGTIREAGFKFGRWLDLEFHQLILPTPADPRDG